MIGRQCRAVGKPHDESELILLGKELIRHVRTNHARLWTSNRFGQFPHTFRQVSELFRRSVISQPHEHHVDDHDAPPDARLVPIAEGTFYITPGLPVRFRNALVIEPLATCHPDVEFCPTLFQVKPQRHQREPFLLDRGAQPLELSAVDEELARTVRFVVGAVAMGVRRDIGADQPKLAVVDSGIRFGYGCLSITNRFDLGAGQDKTGLDGLENGKIMKRPAVAGDHPVSAPV